MKDIDLLEISGKIAYSKKIEVNETIPVNGTEYRVVNIHNNMSGNGLQAMTLLNLETKEYVIAYQGTTDIDDVFTDVSLVSGVTPPQFEDARKYYKEMQVKFNGKVTYVCGNSLGGSLANHVAIQYKEVKSVTYNPAILPTEVTSDIEYKNIKNYVGAYDPLTILQLAAGYEQRIPGEIVVTRDNIPALAFFTANHVGYAENNEINISGGKVPIRVDLLNGLPFSVFTNELLNYNYKGNGKKISINADSMESLKNGIVRISTDISYAQRYLDESLRIVQNESSHLYDRIEELEVRNDEVFRMFGIDIVKLVDNIETELNDMIPILRAIYNIVEKINSVPTISNVFGLRALLNPIANLLTIASEIINASGDLIDSYSHFKRVGIPAFFRDSDKLFDDGLPEKLKKHIEIINANKNIMMDRLYTYELQITGIWNTISEADASNFNPGQIPTTSLPSMNKDVLVENREFENIVEEKNRQLDDNYKSFSNLMRSELCETFHVLYKLLNRFSNGVHDVHSTVMAIETIANYADIPVVSWDDDFFKDIYYNIRGTRKELDQYVYSLDGATEIVRVADGRLDEILISMKPYIKNAIFNDRNYQNIILYNLASYNIYESTSVTFKEIEYQLSENEAETIQMLSSNASLLKSDMQVLMEQIKKGTIC